MKKYHWQILLFIAIVVCLLSCSSTLRTKKYIVEAVRGHTIELKGVDGWWHFPTDTLRVGDTVKLKRVWRESLANVW